MKFKKLAAILLLAVTSAIFLLNADSVVAEETKPTVPVRSDIQRNCPVTYLVPNFLLRGNGMVSANGNATTGCEVIYYYLTDPNLSPNEASKSVEFSLYEMSLNKALDAENLQYINRDSEGNLRPGAGMDFNTGVCPGIARHLVSRISGANWRGWIIESVFRQSASKRVIKYCPESMRTYRCINMAIGNDKVSAMLVPRCFLRRRDYSLHTELSYDTFMEIMKTWRFREQ
jgi:hypothetical protein